MPFIQVAPALASTDKARVEHGSNLSIFLLLGEEELLHDGSDNHTTPDILDL